MTRFTASPLAVPLSLREGFVGDHAGRDAVST
jgi:hypothetical protein